MKRFQFEILFFLTMLFINGIYYYQEGHFKPSGGLILASIFIAIEIVICTNLVHTVTFAVCFFSFQNTDLKLFLSYFIFILYTNINPYMLCHQLQTLTTFFKQK